MGRRAKADIGLVPIREQILEKAIELFSEKSFGGVSIRDITKSVGINESTLYNYFSSKANLFQAILQRLEEHLIKPGFRELPEDYFLHYNEGNSFDITLFLIEGAKVFFTRADRLTLLTWRILMIHQYSNETAYKSIQKHLLDAPVGFFTAMVKALKTAGHIKTETECECAGRIIAALFFDFSFRTNLLAAWSFDNQNLIELEKDLRVVLSGLTT
jgi:AcrR family transcriptional regulator